MTKQADVWAFGCVLFEMLTGTRTWAGRSTTDIIAALVARDPDWNRLPAGLHPRVRFVLERCLEKNHEPRKEREPEHERRPQEPRSVNTRLSRVR